MLIAEQFDFLAELAPYHIEARYGDYKESLSEIINEKLAEQIYNDTGEFLRWLCLKIRQMKSLEKRGGLN
jgi:hypothetical protein